jgi:hypothetical protein
MFARRTILFSSSLITTSWVLRQSLSISQTWHKSASVYALFFKQLDDEQRDTHPIDTKRCFTLVIPEELSSITESVESFSLEVWR